MIALAASTTLKYTTASTRTVTLSRVMPSCAGTGIVTICMFTLRSRSTPGTIMVKPGPRTPSRSRPKRKTTPRSYCLTTRAAAAETAAAPRLGRDDRCQQFLDHDGLPADTS